MSPFPCWLALFGLCLSPFPCWVALFGLCLSPFPCWVVLFGLCLSPFPCGLVLVGSSFPHPFALQPFPSPSRLPTLSATRPGMQHKGTRGHQGGDCIHRTSFIHFDPYPCPPFLPPLPCPMVVTMSRALHKTTEGAPRWQLLQCSSSLAPSTAPFHTPPHTFAFPSPHFQPQGRECGARRQGGSQGWLLRPNCPSFVSSAPSSQHPLPRTAPPCPLPNAFSPCSVIHSVPQPTFPSPLPTLSATRPRMRRKATRGGPRWLLQ